MPELHNCWTCGKRLTHTIEEVFFWCNEDCQSKDNKYHNLTFLPPEEEKEIKYCKDCGAALQHTKFISMAVGFLCHGCGYMELDQQATQEAQALSNTSGVPSEKVSEDGMLPCGKHKYQCRAHREKCLNGT